MAGWLCDDSSTLLASSPPGPAVNEEAARKTASCSSSAIDQGGRGRREVGLTGQARARGLRSPRSCRSVSLESAPDRSYDVPPADERKGKAKAEGERDLGKPIITHRPTLTRCPAGTRADLRQKNVSRKKKPPNRNMIDPRLRHDGPGRGHCSTLEKLSVSLTSARHSVVKLYTAGAG
jgi:hypothetical protein